MGSGLLSLLWESSSEVKIFIATLHSAFKIMLDNTGTRLDATSFFGNLTLFLILIIHHTLRVELQQRDQLTNANRTSHDMKNKKYSKYGSYEKRYLEILCKSSSNIVLFKRESSCERPKLVIIIKERKRGRPKLAAVPQSFAPVF